MLAVVVALSLLGHSASQGKSRFDVDDDGHVAITIELIEPDLKELCDVDFGVVDPEKKRAADEKLDVCAGNELPRWLRLRVDDKACKVGAGRVRHGAGLDVVFSGDAVCPPPKGHTLFLDWGLFAATSLDHQSAATVTLPDGTTTRALLSRRKNKLAVDVKGDVPVVALASAAAVVVVVVVVLSFLLRRRQKSRGARAA